MGHAWKSIRASLEKIYLTDNTLSVFFITWRKFSACERVEDGARKENCFFPVSGRVYRWFIGLRRTAACEKEINIFKLGSCSVFLREDSNVEVLWKKLEDCWKFIR